jgi:hypothetical protein
MLQKLTAKQADCLEHALRCREYANDATDPVDKADWLQMAAGWELLAQSYGLSFRLDDFLRIARRQD